MSSSACPEEEELVRMVEGALGDASLAAIESHVDRCEQCAAVIAGLGAMNNSAAKPRVVGRYQLDRCIGGGGMGEVWAAWDPQLRRDIAVKLVKPDHAEVEAVAGRERERLMREARALARLAHPNVLAVYDVGEVGNEVFIATELVVGDTLASRGGANADWRALVKLYAQAARGLAAAHAVGLVHRDIKPANLLIGVDGRVRVADFGLAVKSRTPSPIAPTEPASSASQDVQITQTGYIAGTPAYMAPEQRLGEPADARADQYALCVALVEAISGRRPPLDVDRDALIAFVAERRAREPDLDRLCTALACGLSIDRDQRFADMNALADALDGCVAPSALSTEHVLPRPRVRRRGVALAMIAGAAALGIAGVLGVSRLTQDHASAERVVTAPAPDAAIVTGESSADALAAVAPQLPIDASAPLRTTPKPPPRLPTSIEPGVQARVDEGLAAARRAMLKRDGKSCLAVIASLPADVPAMTKHNIDLHRGQCEMLAGNCARGIALVDGAQDGMGLPQTGADVSIAMCPIEGPYEVRLKRLLAQAHAAKGVARCRPYVKHAKTLAGEVTAANEKVLVGGVLRSLGSCIGEAGNCAEGEALWKQARDLDQIPMPMEIKGCAPPKPPAPPPAAPNPAAAVTAMTDKLHAMQRAIVNRDLVACRDFVANPGDVPRGLEQSVGIITAHCQMTAGNCKAGMAALAKAYGPTVPADTIAISGDIYCPIEGSLDKRLHRITLQLNTFADRHHPAPSGAWCAHLAKPATTAAREARTDAQRERAAKALQHLAWCTSMAGRCGDALDLWSLSVATDASADPKPRLSAKCP